MPQSNYRIEPNYLSSRGFGMRLTDSYGITKEETELTPNLFHDISLPIQVIERAGGRQPKEPYLLDSSETSH